VQTTKIYPFEQEYRKHFVKIIFVNIIIRQNFGPGWERRSKVGSWFFMKDLPFPRTRNMAAKSNLLELIGFYQYYCSNNSFSACHIACNFSVPQLKFSKAGQRCKYPNSPTIEMKKKWQKR